MNQLLQRVTNSKPGPADHPVQVLGEFKPVATVVQELELVLHPYTALKWGMADRTAKYIAGYFKDILTEVMPAPLCADLADSLNFVANELLENAIKFHFNHFLPLSCLVQQGEKEFVFQVTNSVDPLRLARFYRLIEELISHDPADLFMLHMENNLEGLSDSASGLGLIMIMNDYNGKLGWKFETLAGLVGLPSQVTVTTLVRLAFPD